MTESNPNKEVIEVLLKKFQADASMSDNDDRLPYQVAEKAKTKRCRRYCSRQSVEIQY